MFQMLKCYTLTVEVSNTNGSRFIEYLPGKAAIAQRLRAALCTGDNIGGGSSLIPDFTR